MSDPTCNVLEKALSGDSAALRELLRALSPAVHLAVADALRRHISASVWSRARHDVEDLSQEVLCALFAENGKRLLTWDPDHGLSLSGYVKVIARNLVISFLRKRGNTAPMQHDSWDEGSFEDTLLLDDGPASQVEKKELVGAVLAEMDRTMTTHARPMFRMLFLEALDVKEVCARSALSQNAVHVRQSRLIQQATEVARRLVESPASPRARRVARARRRRAGAIRRGAPNVTSWTDEAAPPVATSAVAASDRRIRRRLRA
ncbi:Hypothetical protein A7982_04487 [Minicystis rosea]|nr:Hypothetical protein A7982_04487 [Minicystis rosea]